MKKHFFVTDRLLQRMARDVLAVVGKSLKLKRFVSNLIFVYFFAQTKISFTPENTQKIPNKNKSVRDGPLANLKLAGYMAGMDVDCWSIS